MWPKRVCPPVYGLTAADAERGEISEEVGLRGGFRKLRYGANAGDEHAADFDVLRRP